MSKYVTADNILNTFPEVLRQDVSLIALAKATAKELMMLFKSNQQVALFTRINELSEDVLDILAYDLKVDWYDKNYSLEEKRATMQSCWRVHRTLGTPQSIISAVSAIYQNVEILEWYSYNGNPYHFKLLIDTGEEFVDYDKFERIVERVKFYKNLRSILEAVQFQTKKSTKCYVGTALQSGANFIFRIRGINSEDYLWYVDENNNCIVDENEMVLFADEEE